LIPVCTTTITVTRPESGDPNSGVDLDSETDLVPPTVSIVTVAEGVRAHFNAGSGTRLFGAGGEREHVSFKFHCDPLPDDETVFGGDTLTDSFGVDYVVLWCRAHRGIGFSYLKGECYQQTGET